MTRDSRRPQRPVPPTPPRTPSPAESTSSSGSGASSLPTTEGRITPRNRVDTPHTEEERPFSGISDENLLNLQRVIQSTNNVEEAPTQMTPEQAWDEAVTSINESFNNPQVLHTYLSSILAAISVDLTDKNYNSTYLPLFDPSTPYARVITDTIIRAFTVSSYNKKLGFAGEISKESVLEQLNQFLDIAISQNPDLSKDLLTEEIYQEAKEIVADKIAGVLNIPYEQLESLERASTIANEEELDIPIPKGSPNEFGVRSYTPEEIAESRAQAELETAEEIEEDTGSSSGVDEAVDIVKPEYEGGPSGIELAAEGGITGPEIVPLGAQGHGAAQSNLLTGLELQVKVIQKSPISLTEKAEAKAAIEAKSGVATEADITAYVKAARDKTINDIKNRIVYEKQRMRDRGESSAIPASTITEPVQIITEPTALGSMTFIDLSPGEIGLTLKPLKAILLSRENPTLITSLNQEHKRFPIIEIGAYASMIRSVEDLVTQMIRKLKEPITIKEGKKEKTITSNFSKKPQQQQTDFKKWLKEAIVEILINATARGLSKSNPELIDADLLLQEIKNLCLYILNQ
ncbi:MAG: hypothetical protein L3J12_09105 [Spirochaetales bacterium]|nr:hypothetical protein [Spirochaetales bacterium]